MIRGTWLKYILPVVVVILLSLVPLVTQKPYYLHILIVIFLSIVLTTSVWLIFTTGQVNNATYGFVAIGAYLTAVLVTRSQLNSWLCLPLAMAAAAIFAALIGIPILRIKGVYFFLVTFALAEVMRLAFAGLWPDVLGGMGGISGIHAPNQIPLGFTNIIFGSRVSFYYLALAIMVPSVLIVYGLARSRIGLIFRAIHASDKLCESSGINIIFYKVVAFAVGCSLAGLVGWFIAPYWRVITPPDFTFAHSLYVLVAMIVGGVGSFFGPVAGAIVLTGLEEYLIAFPYYSKLLYGLVLIVVLLFLPGGLVSLPRKISSWIGRLSSLGRGQKRAVSPED